MKFSEAKDKLKELAKGKYHSLTFDFSEYSSGKIESQCRLYISEHGSKEGSTWEEAFAALEKEINGAPVEEFPDIEPKQAVGR